MEQSRAEWHAEATRRPVATGAPLAAPGDTAFGAMLRRYRLAAGISQDELAERAHLSVRGLSDLERGISRTPRRETVALVAEALGLSPDDRRHLEGAVYRRRGPPLHEPLATPAGTGASAVPRPLTPLLGREAEVASIVTLFTSPSGAGADGSVRLLTLTGPGGVGKTRLALEVAWMLALRVPHGVAFVALAQVAGPDLLLPALAQALGVAESNRPQREDLALALRQRRLLLVLDNVEHLLAAVPEIGALLLACPGLRVLATSRAPLHLAGERLLPVTPLVVPPVGVPPRSDDLVASPAVALFVQRAQAVAPSFMLTATNGAAVAGICARLDGLPLAIELAAASMQFLTPEALLPQLERRLALPQQGPRDLPERQRTLGATVAWSHSMLEGDERALFRRLAVFAGGCTLEAIAAVCGGDHAAPEGVLQPLAGLVEKNMLSADVVGEAPRYRMLETIREYALERLRESGEGDSLSRRHAEYCLALAEAGEEALIGPAQAAWLARLASEHDNLRAALRWACASAEAGGIGLRLAGALARFWEVAGHLREGRAWLDRAVALAGGTGDDGARARALTGAAELAAAQGDFPLAEALAAQALRLYRALGDSRGVVRAATGGVVVAQLVRGEFATAERLVRESLALADQLGDAWSRARALDLAALLPAFRGDLAAVASLREQSLQCYRAAGDTRGVALTLNRFAGLAVRQREYARAARLAAEARDLFETLDDRGGVAESLFLHARSLHEGGDGARAAVRYEQSLALRQERGDRRGSALAAFYLALVLRAGGEGDRATALAADALALIEGHGSQEAIDVLALLGALARDRGDDAEAGARFVAALRRAAEADPAMYPASSGALSLALLDAAARAATRGEQQRAARLAGVSAALRREHLERGPEPATIRVSLASMDDAARRRLEDALGAMLGDEEPTLDRGTALADAADLYLP